MGNSTKWTQDTNNKWKKSGVSEAKKQILLRDKNKSVFPLGKHQTKKLVGI